MSFTPVTRSVGSCWFQGAWRAARMASCREIVDLGQPTKSATAARTATRPPIAAGSRLRPGNFTSVEPGTAMMACARYCLPDLGDARLFGAPGTSESRQRLAEFIADQQIAADGERRRSEKVGDNDAGDRGGNQQPVQRKGGSVRHEHQGADARDVRIPGGGRHLEAL